MMSRLLPVVSHTSIIILAVLAMSYSLPAGFDKVFGQQIGNPLLFFSPLQKRFIYRESLGGHRFNYLNEEGVRFDRPEFEAQLPFLYYKNLEKKNMLPVTVQGRVFNKQAIKADKQGLEIKSRHLDGHHVQVELYPLFNNDPEVAIMPFPEDVFRFTDQTMEFINADFNRVEQELTDRFTSALRENGFDFPATVIGGKTTNLKPFDEGYFIRDNRGQVFHLKRVLNEPVVVKTPIDPGLDILDIILSENRRKEFYGTIITRQGEIYLISYDNYRLISLPVEQYRPAAMDFKLMINPLFKTAVTSNTVSVYGAATDGSFAPLRSFELVRRDPNPRIIRISRDLLFPFQIRFTNPHREQADLQLQPGGLWSVVGILIATGLLLLHSRKKGQGAPAIGELALVLVTGLYGLLAITFVARV